MERYGGFLTFSRRSRSLSSCVCRNCALSWASSACCCRHWIFLFTASKDFTDISSPSYNPPERSTNANRDRIRLEKRVSKQTKSADLISFCASQNCRKLSICASLIRGAAEWGILEKKAGMPKKSPIPGRRCGFRMTSGGGVPVWLCADFWTYLVFLMNDHVWLHHNWDMNA